MSPGNLWKGRADGPRMGYETTEAPAEGGSSLRNPLRSAEPQEVVGEKERGTEEIEGRELSSFTPFIRK